MTAEERRRQLEKPFGAVKARSVYRTEEEKIEARREQWRIASMRYQARLREAAKTDVVAQKKFEAWREQCRMNSRRIYNERSRAARFEARLKAAREGRAA